MVPVPIPYVLTDSYLESEFGRTAGCGSLFRKYFSLNRVLPTHSRSIYEFQANTIDGVPVKLEKYRGQVMVVVNVASKWGKTKVHSNYQCCGSMTFWCGSGSVDPCLWLVDPDLLFSSLTFKIANKNNFFFLIFFLLLFEGTFTSFFKDKKSKRVTK